MPERDLFANFERMRREMDELFGDVFDRALGPRNRGAFSPPWTSSTRATRRGRSSTPSSPASTSDEIGLEIEGRELVIAGHRRPSDAEGRVYQQLEIDFGPFRRTIPLGADVVADEAEATYRDGILRIELPLVGAAAARAASTFPIEIEE